MAKYHQYSSLLTLRRLMSYIYMEHRFLMFLDHTQRRSTVGRTPLDEWSARRRDLYLTTHDTHNRQISMPPVGHGYLSPEESYRLWCVVVCDLETSRIGAPYIYIYIYIYDISSLRVNKLSYTVASWLSFYKSCIMMHRTMNVKIMSNFTHTYLITFSA